MTRSKSPAGPQGESLAARFLEGLGWRILARNYRALAAEIDLVALDGDELVFVEVKTLEGADFGEPEERVGEEKRRQLSRGALHYLQERRLLGRSFRFDVVAVFLGGGQPTVTHFPGAFELHPSFRV